MGVAVAVVHVADGVDDVHRGVVVAQVELDVRRTAERDHADAVGAGVNVKAADDVGGEVEDVVEVVLAHAAGGVDDEDDVARRSTD